MRSIFLHALLAASTVDMKINSARNTISVVSETYGCSKRMRTTKMGINLAMSFNIPIRLIEIVMSVSQKSFTSLLREVF